MRLAEQDIRPRFVRFASTCHLHLKFHRVFSHSRAKLSLDMEFEFSPSKKEDSSDEVESRDGSLSSTRGHDRWLILARFTQRGKCERTSVRACKQASKLIAAFADDMKSMVDGRNRDPVDGSAGRKSTSAII